MRYTMCREKNSGGKKSIKYINKKIKQIKYYKRKKEKKKNDEGRQNEGKSDEIIHYKTFNSNVNLK